jgi:hypothetical protein
MSRNNKEAIDQPGCLEAMVSTAPCVAGIRLQHLICAATLFLALSLQAGDYSVITQEAKAYAGVLVVKLDRRHGIGGRVSWAWRAAREP